MMIKPPEVPHDDDVLLVFRLTEKGQRRRHGQMTWAAAKAAILALQPTVQGLRGAPGKDGANGANGKDGANGRDGAGLRYERYTGAVSGALGIATITFPKEFAAPPLGQVAMTWQGKQMITGTVTATTKTTATVQVMRSVATLLLNASPFEIAPDKTPVTIDVMGL